MKTIANFGLMDVISEDNKDTINFNHGSGKVTFVLAFKGEDINIESAYWRHLGYGGASRDRTDDLIRARDALSQLSYGPTKGWVDYQKV